MTPPRSRAAADADDDVAGSASYRDYGRVFLRMGDAFTSIDEIVQHGISVETADEAELATMRKE